MASPRWKLLLWLLWLWPLVQVWAAEDPERAIRDTADRMIHELKLHRQELEADPLLIYGMVEEIVLPRFDFERISRFVLGRYWREATPAQRQEFVRQFRNLLVRTYAHTLLNYSDQEINYLPVRRTDKPTLVVVPTQVSEPGAPAIPIDYKLFTGGDGRWQVYDVVIDGVSLVSTYRSNFSSQIQRMGLDGVIAWLDQRNSEKAGGERAN